jgi:hypothetical protein
MDLDAEMRKLQEEARRELAQREPAPELPPTPVPKPMAEAAAQVEAPVEEAPGVTLDPDVLRQAANLADKASGLKKLSWKAKLGWGAAALVGFLVAWELFLGKLVMALISVAVLVLLVVAILRVSGVIGPGSGDEDETGEDAKA